MTETRHQAMAVILIVRLNHTGTVLKQVLLIVHTMGIAGTEMCKSMSTVMTGTIIPRMDVLIAKLMLTILAKGPLPTVPIRIHRIVGMASSSTMKLAMTQTKITQMVVILIVKLSLGTTVPIVTPVIAPSFVETGTKTTMRPVMTAIKILAMDAMDAQWKPIGHVRFIFLRLIVVRRTRVVRMGSMTVGRVVMIITQMMAMDALLTAL